MKRSDYFYLPEPPEDIFWLLGSVCFLVAAVMMTVGMQGGTPGILLLAGLACFASLAGLTGLEVAVNALVLTAMAVLVAGLVSLGLFTHGLPPLSQWLPMIAAFATAFLFVVGLILEEIVRYLKSRRTRLKARSVATR